MLLPSSRNVRLKVTRSRFQPKREHITVHPTLQLFLANAEPGRLAGRTEAKTSPASLSRSKRASNIGTASMCAKRRARALAHSALALASGMHINNL